MSARTLCPEGNPQIEAPFIERGWRDATGAHWVSCPCGLAHRRSSLLERRAGGTP